MYNICRPVLHIIMLEIMSIISGFQLIIASVVVGTISVTGLAYLDTTRKIENQQTQINELNAQIASFDDTIATLQTSLSELSGSLQGIEVLKSKYNFNID